MINVYAGRANLIIATTTISFNDAGITSVNTSIIYKVGNPSLSYVPGRSINGVTGFQDGFGYYLVALQDMDLSDVCIPPMTVPLIVFSGESNSGGYALNSQALSSELLSRPAVQILNNDDLEFEPLHIGVNNKLGHYGHEASWTTTHGWELGLANRVEAGTSFKDPCYLVKTGQGSSQIADWANGATASYGSGTVHPWALFQERVDAALDLVPVESNKVPQIYLFYSQGINDALASTNINTWKAATLAHFDKIRAKYGFVPIVMTKFMSAYATFNTAIDDLITQRPHLYAVTTADASQRDANHWDYAGMKLISGRMQDVILENYF